MPSLLYVTPDVGQEQRLARAVRAWVKATSGLTIATTTRRLLDTQGPLAPIWLPVHPLKQGILDVPLRRMLFAHPES